MGCDYCNNTGKVVPFVGEAHDCPKCSILAMPHYKAVLNTVIIDKAKRVEVLDCIIFSGLTQDAIHSLAKLPLEDQFAAFQKHCNLEYGIRIPDASINDPDAVQDLLKGKISKDELNGMLTAMFAPEPPQVFCDEMFHKDGLTGNALNNFKITVPGIQNEIDFEASLETTEICYHEHRDGSIHKVLNCVYYAHAHKLIDDDEYESIGRRPLSQQAAVLGLMKGINTTTKFKEEFISGLRDTGVKDSGLQDHKIQRLCNPTISSIVNLLRATMRTFEDGASEAGRSKVYKRLNEMRRKLIHVDASMMGRVHQLDRVPLLATNESLISREQAEKYCSNLERTNRG